MGPHAPKLSGCRPWLPINQLVLESSFKEVRPAHLLPGGSLAMACSLGQTVLVIQVLAF